MLLEVTKLHCPAAGFGSGLPVVIGVVGALFGQRIMDSGDFFLGRGNGAECGAQLRAQDDGPLNGRSGGQRS